MVSTRSTAVLSVLSLAAAVGCVSSPVLAPLDGQIFLSANPNVIVLDEFAVPPVTTASTVVSAEVVNSTGVPQADVSVVFITNGGELASAPAGQTITPLETDPNGFVSDTLTVQLGDPDMITVTVRSGALTEAIAVAKTEVAANQPPFAFIDIDPAGTASFGQTVIYNGTNSSDPDGDLITCYQWQIESSETIASPELPCVPPNSRCEVSQGLTNSILTRSYGMALTPGPSKMVVVTLRVTDDPSIACPPAGPAQASADFNGLAVEAHDVVCDRFMPVANAGPSRLVPVGPLLLSAAASNGGDSGIVRYDWDCGNGTVVLDGSVSMTCDYTTAATYFVGLTVTNGCGVADSVTVTITVS